MGEWSKCNSEVPVCVKESSFMFTLLNAPLELGENEICYDF